VGKSGAEILERGDPTTQFKHAPLLKGINAPTVGAYEQSTRRFAPTLESGGQESMDLFPSGHFKT